MELVTPGIGLVFWTAVVFILLFVLLGKLAWKPIMGAIKEREESIDSALKLAQKAKEEMTALQASNEKLLAQARIERDNLLKEAREAKENMIAEAKSKAGIEAARLMEQARISIQNEKMAALSELKNQVATMSIEIAEKIIRAELSNDDKQKALISNMMNGVSMN